MSNNNNVVACPRCGIRREVEYGVSTDKICGDCKSVEPGWPHNFDPPTGIRVALAREHRLTHFKCGHEKTPENTFTQRNSPRCAVCRRRRDRKYSQKYRNARKGAAA